MLRRAILDALGKAKRGLGDRDAIDPVDARRWIATLQAADRFAPDVEDEAAAVAAELEALFPPETPTSPLPLSTEEATKIADTIAALPTVPPPGHKPQG